MRNSASPPPSRATVCGRRRRRRCSAIGLLREALEKCREVTDEAGAIEALGFKPKLVRADATNLKVTYPADLALAAMILRGRK